ncbi:uncharacterized protein LOC135348428 [Halichondria panicea]|uniref:uncharacterized protein LOC135348428 n=1 Tax=Halichondria panicea TaxID=6063 RepID=UPI00312B9908
MFTTEDFIFILLLTISIVSGEASLVSNSSVACPGEAVLFTCSSPGTTVRWQVNPPAESGLMSVQSIIFLGSGVGRRDTFGSGVIMFEAVLVSNDGGTLTSTLINLSEVSVLDGSNVTCTLVGGGGDVMESQQTTVVVAVAPTFPLNLRLSASQNQINSSIINVEWDTPSSTGGVSVRYVLTISPTPLSGSPVTMDTTSAQMTISYNAPYSVTIKAVNCAGSSTDVMVMIPSIVVCPSNPPPADRVTIVGGPPLPALLRSTLSFICNGETVTASCDSDGRWSPDPTTYVCSSEITCGSPAAPFRGSVDISSGVPPFPLSSEVTYRCDEGLFPAGDMTSTCESVGGVGTWRPDNTNIICRDMLVNCSLPEEPSNTTILDYDRLNETVLEGTVLTYHCDNGLSLIGPNTITCTNAGVWSTEPEAIMCVLHATTEDPTATSLSVGVVAAISVIITFFVAAILGFLTGLLVMHLCSRKKAIYSPATEVQANVGLTAQPAGPVYEEVSPKEEMELNTNQAYGPLGL